MVGFGYDMIIRTRPFARLRFHQQRYCTIGTKLNEITFWEQYEGKCGIFVEVKLRHFIVYLHVISRQQVSAVLQNFKIYLHISTGTELYFGKTHVPA